MCGILSSKSSNHLTFPSTMLSFFLKQFSKPGSNRPQFHDLFCEREIYWQEKIRGVQKTNFLSFFSLFFQSWMERVIFLCETDNGRGNIYYPQSPAANKLRNLYQYGVYPVNRTSKRLRLTPDFRKMSFFFLMYSNNFPMRATFLSV